MGFSVRTSRPNGNKNFIRTASGGWNTCIKGSPTASGADALANCVGYASGRFNEIINEARGTTGCTYKTLNCNAEGFIERALAAGLKIGSTPRVGAIGCAMKGATLSGNDGAGHVWIVERVNSSSSIYTSESGYGSTAFWNQTRSNSNGKWGLGSGYSFRAFIYLPDDIQKIVDGASGGSSGGTDTHNGYTGKFKIGDDVIINGNLYTSSTAQSSNGSVSNKTTKITRVAKNTAHPYNTTGDLGWMNESDIKLVSNESAGTSEWPKSYTIQNDDTLSGIAKKFYGNGDAAHYNFIASANGISNPNVISAGKKLTIPEYKGSSSPAPSTSINVGDTVIVNGSGRATAAGTGASTKTYSNQKAKVIYTKSGAANPYALNMNNNMNGVTGWFPASAVRK